MRQPEDCNPYSFFSPTRQFRRGEWLFQESDRAVQVYLLEEGLVKVSEYTEADLPVTKDILTTGALIGEGALFSTVRYPESARCQTACKLRVLPAMQLKYLMLQHPELSQWVLEQVGRRLQRAERRRYDLLHRTSRRRILLFLGDWVRERGQRVGLELVVRQAYAHGDIAGITGTCRQTVNTVLNDLRREGLVHFTRRYLIVREPEAFFTRVNNE